MRYSSRKHKTQHSRRHSRDTLGRLTMFEVCYSGNEDTFDTVDQAEAFCWDLMVQGVGSDIWVDEVLYKSYIYDFKTRTFSIEGAD